MPIIQVQPWGKDQGDFVEINDFDFNPEIHKLLTDDSSDDKAKLTAAELKAKLTELSIEFKGNASRDALQAQLDAYEAAEAVLALKAKLTEKGVVFDEAATAEELQALLDAAE